MNKTKSTKTRKVYKIVSIKLELKDYNLYTKKCAKNNWLISEKPKEAIYRVINQD